MIENIRIRNFKSLRDVSIGECRRINVFIGRPNVGKSNILEALALLETPLLRYTRDKSLSSLIRVGHVPEMFFDGNVAEPITIDTDDCSTIVQTINSGRLSQHIIRDGQPLGELSYTDSLKLTGKKPVEEDPTVLTYFFPKNFEFKSLPISFLMPVGGANLPDVVSRIDELKADVDGLFGSYNLKLVVDKAKNQIVALKYSGNDIFLVPFASLADSLQRLIFYKSAILSNRGRTLCFEEPESHTFPPFISSVVTEMIEAVDNQFFLTTQSPYIVNDLLGSAGDDLAIYIVDIKGPETVVKRLSNEEMQQAYDNGVDMFFNLELYQNG